MVRIKKRTSWTQIIREAHAAAMRDGKCKRVVRRITDGARAMLDLDEPTKGFCRSGNERVECTVTPKGIYTWTREVQS